MSIVRRCSNLRQSNEDVVACLEQKNNVINLLQMEVDELRENQERYDRAKEHLFRIKSNYESLLREFDCEKDRNQEKQDLLAKNVSDLKLQIDHLENDLKVKNLALQEAKFGCQQLMALESRKEDETAEMEIKLQEQKGLA